MKPAVNRQFSGRLYLGDVFVRPLRGGTPISANALNFSRGGMSLFCMRFLEVGQPVELVLRAGGSGGKANAYTFQGHVAEVRVDTAGNIMDVTFTRILTLEEMQELETKLGMKARV